MKKLEATEKLLIKLLKIDSFSGQEKQIAEFIETQLVNFKIKRQHICKNRFNIIAKKGKSDIWIVAHMDTVQGRVPIKITNNKIFGRGAIDNKGNIAGAIMASEKLDNINLLFTVGEEEDFVGAQKANIKGKAIVLEPTNLKRRIAQCGVIIANLKTKGMQKHSSIVVDEKNNAIHFMIRKMNKLLDKKWTAFNIGTIKGGLAPNIISSESSVDISIRPKNKAEHDDIINTLSKIKDIEVNIIKEFPPHFSSLSVIDSDGSPVTFFSELSFFERGVLFGVGDIEDAHTESEHVLRSDLRSLPEELIKLVKDLT